MADLLAGQGIAMWSVFFLVPVGRGVEEQRIAPEEYETVFERLWHHAQRQPYAVKTTEAPHYRRFVLQHGGDPLAGPGRDAARRSPPAAAIARRWASATARASCSSATPAKSIRPVPAAVLRAVPARFGGRRLPESPHVPGPARSRPLQGPVRHLRVSARLRRQPRPGVRRHRRLPGVRAGLRLRASGWSERR